jgi:hypothetical protein
MYIDDEPDVVVKMVLTAGEEAKVFTPVMLCVLARPT